MPPGTPGASTIYEIIHRDSYRVPISFETDWNRCGGKSLAVKSANVMLRQVQSAPVDGARQALCPSCGRVAGFKFVGIQNGGLAPVVLWLWVCGACGSVRAEKSLMEPVMV